MNNEGQQLVAGIIARKALEQADAAYTAAVSHAARTGDWGHARQAREALHQARTAGGAA